MQKHNLYRCREVHCKCDLNQEAGGGDWGEGTGLPLKFFRLALGFLQVWLRVFIRLAQVSCSRLVRVQFKFVSGSISKIQANIGYTSIYIYIIYIYMYVCMCVCVIFDKEPPSFLPSFFPSFLPSGSLKMFFLMPKNVFFDA